MITQNKEVETFIKNAKAWKNEILKIRNLLLSLQLDESLKWQKPCYSFKESNIVIIQPFKSCLGLMFFKGSLLKDSNKILVNNGPNSQAAKRLEFHSVEEIEDQKDIIKKYIKEAINIEESGEKVTFKKTHSTPEELKNYFKKNQALKNAFHSLTPGRQRAYILFFTSAKQSETRNSRIEKLIPQILKGKGIDGR